MATTALDRMGRIAEVLRLGSARQAEECLRQATYIMAFGLDVVKELLGSSIGFPPCRVDHVGFLLSPSSVSEFLRLCKEVSGVRTKSFPSSVAAMELGCPTTIYELSAGPVTVEAVVPERADVRTEAAAGRAVHMAYRILDPNRVLDAIRALGEIGFLPAPFTEGSLVASSGSGTSLIYLDGPSRSGRIRVELCVRNVSR